MIVVSLLDDFTSLFTPRLMWEILYKYPTSTSHCAARSLQDGQLAAVWLASLRGTGACDL